jgi:hypothetical protein
LVVATEEAGGATVADFFRSQAGLDDSAESPRLEEGS